MASGDDKSPWVRERVKEKLRVRGGGGGEGGREHGATPIAQLIPSMGEI